MDTVSLRGIAFVRQLTEAAEQKEDSLLIKLLKFAALVVLACLSAVFSGLNLGLMCLNASQLEVLIQVGDEAGADKEAIQQAAWARKILPYRKDGNTLLCTLLLGNVMVNSYMAVLLDEMWSGIVAVIASTFIIVTFGEIIPQSLCYKHGLRIGAALMPLLCVFWYLLLLVSKPLAFVLDCIFGEEIGETLDKHQLSTLIDYQRQKAPHLLTEQEANILHGSIDFSTKTAQSIMVPLGECFCLDAGAIINPGLCATVAAMGFSRIPVIDRDPRNPRRQFAVIGLIHVKDLLLIDAEYDLPLKAVLQVMGRDVFIVDDVALLPDLLEEFRRGKSQLAVVQSIVSSEDSDPYFRHVGILTLQDVLNTIVQDDVHEVDAADDMKSEVSSVPSNMFSNVPRFKEPSQQLQVRQHANRARNIRPVRGLSSDDVVAAAAFLRRRHPILFGDIHHETLEAFLWDCRLVGSTDEALYRRGQASSHATLVVTGDVKVLAGSDSFESIHGPWSLLAKRSLELTSHAIRNNGNSGPTPVFVPDFTAHTAEDTDEHRDGTDGTRLLLIAADAYRWLLMENGKVTHS
mmetsp:Transcript_70409/g.139693  ORF Transcript_70409/g.139693 Transcript_70409/m.139693 type:complete len:574 (+) Transcript_70409:118-1839(+)